MPIYEFKCAKCANKYEELVAVGGDSTGCPKCGSKEIKKCFSAFGVKSGDTFTSSSSGCSSCSKASCTSCKSS